MINIFAKPAFVNTSPGQPYAEGRAVAHGHLQRVSSMIRGEQIAARLGANLNPGTIFADDTCIYVKPHIKPGSDFEFKGRAWLDIIDGWALRPVLAAHPEVGVIACSDTDGETLRRILPNRVVVIPQHHANFERQPRIRQGVSVVGVIGTEDSFKYLPAGLEAALAERGLRLWCYSKFYTRADIVNFYLNIDVQIVWRPWRKRLANPLKLVNAAAFGVPTVALRETYFDEVDDIYYPVNDFDGLLALMDRAQAYDAPVAALRGLQLKAERYHIDAIAQKYRAL